MEKRLFLIDNKYTFIVYITHYYGVSPELEYFIK